MPRRYWPKTQDAFRSYTGGYTIVRKKDGYVEEYCPTHPACNSAGRVLQHRLVMERKLGRYLSGIERVHHGPDPNRQNNAEENLTLFANQAEHMRHHRRNSASHNPETIAMVRKAAADPDIRVKDLPLSGATVLKICKINRIQWMSRAVCDLTEAQVRRALRGRTTLQAAQLLGVNHQTLRNRFDHLLTKRKSPTTKARKRGASQGAPGSRRSAR